MPTINYFAVIVAGLIPSALGALYYGPLFGKVWRNSLGKTEDQLAPDNPALAYGGSMVLSMVLSFFLNFVIQIVHKNVNEVGELVIASHNTFGHGALHGAIIGITMFLPVIVSLGIFHKLNWKVNALNALFWIFSLALMGGILDVWK